MYLTSWSAADAEVSVKSFVKTFPMTLKEFESLKPENLQQYELLMKTTIEELQLWYNLAKVLDDCWKRAIISSAIFEQTYIMESSVPF
ncbi:hypothetical protein MiSe_25250 [Microseira wollei NIES-4236]|uniref:Uncharacterized protein n=1 Tax=Microseira wollei NIES-4236 TaxID=2530354 RepID=A0AAV3X905_9CYAN|nr:hypothetical protein MiSe_25250 [Microseira wollei NIES-4236]